MAWSWSHTTEGICAAYDNLHKLPHHVLCEIAAEWDTWKKANEKNAEGDWVDDESFDQVFYNERLKFYEGLTSDCVADYIWPFAEEKATCTNGGYYLWMCPYGCCCHMVPPGEEEEDE